MAPLKKLAIECISVWLVGTAILITVIARLVDDPVSAFLLGFFAASLWFKGVVAHYAPAVKRAEEREVIARFFDRKPIHVNKPEKTEKTEKTT